MNKQEFIEWFHKANYPVSTWLDENSIEQISDNPVFETWVAQFVRGRDNQRFFLIYDAFADLDCSVEMNEKFYIYISNILKSAIKGKPDDIRSVYGRAIKLLGRDGYLDT